ncbi:RDD family protein [Cohnella lupini]|uniref:Putative RDD family membrane protein YckC n=1 Tax=Cohnella lupini TaxID=1294267 RepID=A0A3D9IXT7_9BACL|nr:RDD family protein [Cohnella lupini]RED66329.1 putative RDD family membrane protein YckC [Cohnella lupini]
MKVNEPAGFWIRFGAIILDALIIAVPLTIISVLFTGGLAIDKYVSNTLSFLYSLLTPILWNGYTIGKRICGIRIARVDDGTPPGLGTMLLRNVVAGILYAVTLGIAIIASAIMIGVREDKRSLHDFIAGTEVIRD